MRSLILTIGPWNRRRGQKDSWRTSISTELPFFSPLKVHVFLPRSLMDKEPISRRVSLLRTIYRQVLAKDCLKPDQSEIGTEGVELVLETRVHGLTRGE